MSDSNTQSGTKGGWIAPTVGAATSLIGMIGQRARERRAMNNQKELMGIQFNNQQQLNKDQFGYQQELNQQGHELQMQMWNDTNYEAQMKHIKNAGLNPALLYGMSGGGGVTTGSQGGGSASAGSASSGNAPAPQHMDLSAIMQGIQLNIAKSMARKAEAEAEQQELKNKAYLESGQRADILEGSNRAKAAQQESKVRYDETVNGRTGHEQLLLNEVNLSNEKINWQNLINKGLANENEVSKYKAELAKAKIDPDSNPIVREVMKAMAANGVPLSKILEKIIKMML